MRPCCPSARASGWGEVTAPTGVSVPLGPGDGVNTPPTQACVEIQ